jgi:hypothetical protein
MNKKAQATAFIIAGIVIVSMIFTGVYFREQIFNSLTKDTLAEQPTISQIEKVKSFTKDCLQESLDDGTYEIGLKGGHLTIPAGDFPPTAYNPMTNSLNIFGSEGLSIPYWSFLTPNNLEKTQIPSKQEMETELSNFVESEVVSCLNDYTLFKSEGYNIEFTAPKVAIEIGNEAVIADVEMTLNINYKESSQTFSKFKTISNVPLGKLYARSLELFEYEARTGFVENFTIETMVVYDEIPFSGVDFECTPRTWLKSQVVQDLKSILALNIPTLKIEGTDFVIKDRKDEQLIHEVFKKNEKDLTVSLMSSPSWPLMVDVIGTDSEILRGKPFTSENEAARFLLPLFCLNDYHFVYDLKFPVLATLTEDDYVFQFPFVAVVDNNQAKKNKFLVPQFEEEQQICERKDTTLKVTALGVAADGSTVALDGADISLQCVFTECEAGITRREGNTYSLTTQFPQCLGGKMTASKNGYHPSSFEVDTNQEGLVNIPLEAYYELPVEIIVDDEGTLRTPYDTENILFQFENEDQEYFTTYYYPSTEKLKLIAGNYHITATLMVETDRGFNFPEREIEICSEVPKRGIGGIVGLTETKCTQQTIDPIELEAVVAGGGSTTWSADRRVLATSNKITLYTYRGKTPNTFEELNNVYTSQGQFSKNMRNPTFE